ncbi:dolichol-phosphate mannosyltransferase subunit 3 [Conidiobolus coronatus NRRL 28638]|uniref:Dolichol-phosphate mannosyltransferase subunit 3 n=1 Tax=Conidiobolus coronatus (strain ATCC 28846 / CBS 209.66 / NRRL 28638) TaxID=796925 RepID=A0A137P2L9_CONC2|nr:dolichol-phosphate mannosyltransferase subunit 3 [Conidiobolus coronatus NRRL 28638]|eukprot:KXN69277.1 dolichol-phosphate mannosyltransferase subunit 3 [Conidiobolus coronatus NRRL 28638]
MTKATETFSLIGAFLLSWALVNFNFITLPISQKFLEEVWPTFPWVALVSFGAYSLANIGWALITFRDCPEAHQELMVEIQQAKADLRAKKVQIDN